MLRDDVDALRLTKQVFHFAEFLEERGIEPPKLARKAVVHGHCHEKATSGFTPLQKQLEKMGLDLELPDSGCCGMAGAWGYERGHYDVSMACGERKLLPTVRGADGHTLLVTDGFSCKTQIEQGAGKHALHLAEVLRLADGKPQAEQPRPSAARRLARAATLALAALAGLAALASRYP
jgi:Fe-S oxidoreductase